MDKYDKPAKLKHPKNETLKKGTKITYRGSNRKSQGDLADFNKEFKKYPKISLSEREYRKMFNDPSDMFMYITNENIYPVCKLKYKRFPFAFLEPNPITFYYSIANDLISDFEVCHENLSTIFKENIEPNMKGGRLARIFSYLYKVNSIAITFLTMALEAFANQEIPDYGTMPDGSKINRNKVENYENLITKLEKRITRINQKNFALKYPKRMERISRLISLRHEIVHLKKKAGSGITRYEKFYQQMLDFNLKKLLGDVKSYLNFYFPGLIINYKM